VLDDTWPADRPTGLRDALAAAYADPGRGYHDTLHLQEVLERIAEIGRAGVAFDGDAVVLAAWFHDAVHDGEPGDEERSAQWAERELTGALGAEVARLVRMTEHHRPADDDVNGAVLSDADLGILAASPQRYADYVATVRREYAQYDDATFAAGRAAVLRDLLAKPHLFHTAHARAAWEDRARANVERELG
jgi:predicted metal-dependent HD superfamily phosphohydrolase